MLGRILLPCTLTLALATPTVADNSLWDRATAGGGNSPFSDLAPPFNGEPPYPESWLLWGLTGHYGIAEYDFDGNGMVDTIDYRPYVMGNNDPDQWFQVNLNYPGGTKTVRYDITSTGDQDLIQGHAYKMVVGTDQFGVKDFAIAFKNYGETFDDPDTFKVVNFTGVNQIAGTTPLGGITEVDNPEVYFELDWMDNSLFEGKSRVFLDSSFTYVPSEFADKREIFITGGIPIRYLQWTSSWTIGFDLPTYSFMCEDLNHPGYAVSCGTQQFCGLPGANPNNCSAHVRVDRRLPGDINPSWWSQLIQRFELPCNQYLRINIWNEDLDTKVDEQIVTSPCGQKGVDALREWNF